MQKTLLLINNFVVNTTSFLNNFTDTCEKKISVVSGKLTELEILLAVMEAKLNSIPPSDGSAPPPSGAAAASAAGIPDATASTTNSSSSSSGGSVPPPVATSVPSGTDASPAAPVAPVDDGLVAVKDHPDYKPYAKLLKVGVPLQAAKVKLMAAGELKSVYT